MASAVLNNPSVRGYVFIYICRDHWLQLGSLWQVMREMADLSRLSDKEAKGTGTGTGQQSTAGGGRVRLTSARASKLTVLLAPLLQGNTKVGCVMDGGGGVSWHVKTVGIYLFWCTVSFRRGSLFICWMAKTISSSLRTPYVMWKALLT